MKGMHVHHKIPRSKGGTDAPENLFVCSPSFHANAWHSGKYLMILNASDVARMGGLARQKKGLSKDGFLRMQKHGERLGCLCRDAGIGIFARSPEKRMEDARKAGKAGIKSTLAKNPNHMREIGLKGGAPGKSVIAAVNGVETVYKSISKAIKATGVSRTRAYRFLGENGVYTEELYTLLLT
jgi:general stress protein YciG